MATTETTTCSSHNTSAKRREALQWLERFYIENWHYDQCAGFKYRIVYPDGSVRWIDDPEVASRFRIVAGEPPPKKKRSRRKKKAGQKKPKKARAQRKLKKRRAKYLAYLESDEWREVRCLVLERDHATCVLCGSTTFLHVHHRHYKTLYVETGKELATLCRGCHKRLHRQGWKAAKMGDLVLGAVR